MLGISIQIDELLEGDIPNAKWWVRVDDDIDTMLSQIYYYVCKRSYYDQLPEASIV